MPVQQSRLAMAGVWLAWVVSLALIAAAIALGFRPEVADYWILLPLATGYPLAGAIILTSRPGHSVGRVMLGVGLAAGLAAAAHAYATRAIVLDPGSLPFATAAAWLGTWVWALSGMPAMTILLLLFPDGRLCTRRWRPVMAVSVLAVASAAVGFGLAPGRLSDFPSVHNPVGVGALRPVTGVLQAVFFPLLLVALVGAVASLVVRWRRADPDMRQRLDLVLAAMVVFVGVVMLAGALQLPMALSATVQVVATLLVPAAIVIGVLQRQLFEIKLIVKPSLVYAALTASVLGMYVAVVQVVGQLGGGLVGPVVATGVVAVAFEPLHRRLHRGVDRLLHGDRADPTVAVARLVGYLTASSAPDLLLAAAAAGVGEALRVPGVKVTAVVDGSVVGEAEWGIFQTEVEHVPVHFYADLVGHLTVARRESQTLPNRADDRVLSLLLPHVATAMHIVRLTADLNAAREQAVRVREEERRRIRRDLHDGLGPVLAGLGLSLEGVSDLVEVDPRRARVSLGELAESVHATIADVRRLVYELRPPALDDLGLLGALREHVNSIARHPGDVVVTVDAPDELPELPAAVEVAVFRIAMEALTNVERHAHASRCTLRLRLDDGIELTVEDDGVGINGHAPGVGIPSMRERVRELNGRWSLEARQPTGTRLRARLPLSSP
ncbi:MAG: hypothetical protein HY826_06085 [Actinobacteria bacterium]|nr:hypothetical protein [Actinomycetota bacterium]